MYKKYKQDFSKNIQYPIPDGTEKIMKQLIGDRIVTK